MGFRVLYHLNTSNIKGIAEEARWAESMGYDGLSARRRRRTTRCSRWRSPLQPRNG